ncbi:MAG: TolC family protein [Armatimonadetes bacterium]|nr:TolC family protein [Armatimonadota bacterium]
MLRATAWVQLVVPSVALALGGAGLAQGRPPAGDAPRLSGPLSLRKALETGLRDAPTVRAMAYEAESARAESRAARAMAGPQLAAHTTLSTGDMTGILGSAPGVDPAGSIMAPARASVDQNLTLMAPIHTGGRLAGLTRAARQRALAADAGVGVERADTALMIRDAYYRALLAAEMVKVARARVEAAAEMERTAQALFDAGKGIQAAVARARAERADGQRMLALAQNDEAAMLIELTTAMGIQPDSPITLSDALTEAPAPPDPAALVAEALRTRPDLLAARARVEAARADAQAARGARGPQVYGAAMADAFAPSSMGRNGGYTVGAVVSLPLLDGGRLKAEAEAAQAMVRRAEAQLQAAELRTRAEVARAYLDAQTARAGLTAAQEALAAAQEACDVALLRVQNQKAIPLELLDAVATLTEARTNRARSLYDGLAAAARLRRAAGRTEE